MFSIITPSFNVMPVVKRCVGSVRGQADVKREHLVRDGGSTDGTREWLREQDGLNVVSEPDRGMYDAINKGWTRAEGDILSWLNADEQYLPGTLEKVERVFLENPDVDLVSGNAVIVDKNGNPLAARRELPLDARMIAHTFLYAFSCTMFFRATLRERGLLALDPTYRIAGDRNVILGLLNAGVRCVHLNQFLSLFGAGEANLSANREIGAAEARRVRAQHGYTESAVLQKGFRLWRWTQRLARGHYRSASLAYAYALDEKPVYREVRAERVPARFDIGRYTPSP